MLRRIIACWLLVLGCNSDSSNDGGTDATTEPPIDICTMVTGVGTPCPYISNTWCDPIPNCMVASGCQCRGSDTGPRWVCVTPPECTSQCMSSSPLCDAGVDATPDSPEDVSLQDVIEDAPVDAGLDAADGE